MNPGTALGFEQSRCLCSHEEQLVNVIWYSELQEKMSSATKADKKAALDAASWMFNVVTSVGIIIVNKALMATYGFSFGMFWMMHY